MYILVGSVTTATRLKKVAEKIIGFPAVPIPCVLMTVHLMKSER